MDDVTNFCEAVLRHQPGLPSFDQVVAALREVSIEGFVDPSWMHRHVLGFTQLRLMTMDRREVRMHHWPISGIYSEEPHTHLWDLTSYVLLGRIQSRTYEVRARPDDEHLIFTVRQTGAGTVREPTNRHVKASVKNEEEFERGDVYVVPQGVFHTSAPLKGEALTLIVTSQPSVDRPEVVASDNSPRAGHAPMTPVTPAEVQRFRSALTSALS